MLKNAPSSVLINRNLSDEFQLFRGLRQGDPVSTFLFIISMEGLHITMEDVVAEGMFWGITLYSSNLMISHLFYADDAQFLGDWNKQNIKNLIRVL